MKIHIFLLILNFIRICFSWYVNVTNTEYPSCPAFRGKRALKEYTRWRANQMTKPEFIVKVDDDILSPTIATPKPVVAINVLPMTKAAEKIIINAAINPTSRVTGPTTDVPMEYTRFVPPTTVRLTQVDDELYLAPVKHNPMTLVKGLSMNRPSLSELAAKNPDRDDSPPASPQFISRVPILVSRQYAPITSVAFYPRTALPPVPPPTSDPSIPQRTTSILPARTTLSDIEAPTRTDSSSNLINIFQPVVESNNALDSFLAASDDEHKQGVDTRRIVSGIDLDETTVNIESNTPTRSDLSQAEEGVLQNKILTTTDSVYHMMYYNEDDNELSTSKKPHQDIFGNDEKKEEERQSSEKDFGSEKVFNATEDLESENYVEHLNGNVSSKNDDLGNTMYDGNNLEDINSNTTKGFDDENVTKGFDDENVTSQEETLREKRRPICKLLKLRELGFKSPRTLPEIVAQLKRWTDISPIAKWIDITGDNYTTMENPIYMMIIDDPTNGQRVSSKHTVLIVAGIQGRDHHAVTAALYMLYQLIERSDAHADLLAKYRFWIIPVFNPDGYDYSMTFPQRREWSKNLRQSWEPCKGRDSCSACETQGLRCTVQPCYGVNLDRNFEYQWIPTEELRAEHPCGSLFAGTRQLSEHETRSLTRYLHQQRSPPHTFIALKEGNVLWTSCVQQHERRCLHQQRSPPHTFIALEEGNVLGVMYPHSHTRKKRVYDQVYKQRASRAASAAYSISGRPYVAGQTSEFLPLYAGGIEDWVDGHLGIDNTYTVMLYRPIDYSNRKLITELVVHEAYAAMDTLLLQSLEPPNRQPVRQVWSAGSRNHPALLLLTLLAITS